MLQSPLLVQTVTASDIEILRGIYDLLVFYGLTMGAIAFYAILFIIVKWVIPKWWYKK